ncbi:tetratricopeptide repeat protein [Moheibacter sediminis]|uniref:Uncharacterized protein n=1 Tax=Moheibacter sediminis TaxID=1434700 RepID=A0A1W2BUE4_9FLAO|nr:hypothetical protein [Moheibacter sediminis]SMC76511.1 hypothetical protein SAMN06296427_107149 [Moheibacter sediminis]
MKTLDKYLFSALDNYPYNLLETIESLEYALSYNDKNTMALCLMGRVYAEQLMDYETAKDYFSEAISHNIHALEIYPNYIETLILNEDFDEAEKLIEFALTIKGINKIEILLKKVLMLEIKKEFSKAKLVLKEIKSIICTSNYDAQIKEFKERINSKTKGNKKGQK